MEKLVSRLKYTDIYSLELYQCILMIIVNPVQLVEASHALHENPYILSCAVASVLIGLFSIYSIQRECISTKRFTSKLHWILCFTIVALLVKDISHSPYTMVSFYSSQLLCSIYCYWRISIECFVREEK